MSNKPIVDELREKFQDRVRVTRVDLFTPAGRELAARYQFTFTPFFVGLDSQGAVVWKQTGMPPAAGLLEQLVTR